jgi:two-component system, chemotaxis family, chemotaxis protein CheY
MARIVLIVEDTQQYASSLEIALTGIPGLEIAYATTGAAALRYLESNKSSVCAMLTDLNMPQMDGFELIRLVRGSERYTRLPIIVLSGDTDPRTPARTRDLGADAYFAKPYSPTEVRNKLEQLLHAYQT